MALERGQPAPERREGRERLSIRDPRIETMLAGISVPEDTLPKVRSWSNALMIARDLWADQNRRGRRYSDRETAQARNSLARGGRGGVR